MCDLRGRDRPVADYNGFSPQPWDGPRFIPTTLLTSLFTDFDAAAHRYGAVQQSEIHRQLERLCPSSQACRRHCGPSTGIGQQEQHRGFDLPALETARAEFCEVLRVDVDWGTGAVTPVDKKARNESAQSIAEDHAWWDSDVLTKEACAFGAWGGSVGKN